MDSRRHRLLPGIAGLVALALVASACGSDDPDSSAAEAVSTPPTEAAEETTTTEFDDSEVELTNEQPEPEEEASTTSEAAPEDEPVDESEELFPDVVDATAVLEDDGTWTFNATLSSPYDSPARYADAWRVVGPDGTEYGLSLIHI